jgi:hypothetical protein
LTPDQLTAAYKLNASNPGQFSYNTFCLGCANLTVSVPYPFVTQGAVPIHVYGGVSTTTVSGKTCYVPVGTEIANSNQTVALNDYGPNPTLGTTTHDVPLTLPGSGPEFVTIHLDYGLKGETGCSKTDNTSNPGALCTTPTPTITIPNLQPYPFGGCVGAACSPTPAPPTPIQSENVFKKAPGIGGLVLQSGTNQPQVGVQVKIYSGSSASGTPLATLNTDADGWYMWQYNTRAKQPRSRSSCRTTTCHRL